MRAIKFIFNSIFLSMVLALGACSTDDSKDYDLVEFGTTGSEFTVEAGAGQVRVSLLSNQTCMLTLSEDADEWIILSTEKVRGDSELIIDFDDNPDYPRMATIRIDAQPSGRSTTISVKQKGSITPEMTLPSTTLLVDGAQGGSGAALFTTNVNVDEISTEFTFAEGEDAWLHDVTFAGDKVVVSFDPNPSASDPRSAQIALSWVNGWNETTSATLFVLQKNSQNTLGRDVSFEDVRAMCSAEGDEIMIDEYILLTGRIVSDSANGNAGDNPKTALTTADYSVCKKTIYLESLDGKYGFSIETATEADNIFKRYDKATLLLNGLKLTSYADPLRYELSGLTTAMIAGSEAGTAADIPVKEKYISELADEDIYTYVTLKDCEFPIRKGSLTPFNEGYTLTENNGHSTKYPRLVRDIEGSSIHTVINTTCTYRREDFRWLPYGSGDISGVVVFEYFPSFMYGDGPDEESHGNIGRYQLRTQSYNDIQFDEDESSFSALLTEYRYAQIKQDQATARYYFLPTEGDNGRMWHTARSVAITGPPSTFNFVGMVGWRTGIPPFNSQVANSYAGTEYLGYVLADEYAGYNEELVSSSRNSKVTRGTNIHDGWRHQTWWNDTTDTPESWLVEFSTLGIMTDVLSMQFTSYGSRTDEIGVTPSNWKIQWSETGDTDKAGDWTDIAEYYVPDGVVSSAYREWQLPAMRQYNFNLPLELLDKEKVYIRLCPRDKTSNTNKFGAGEISAGNNNSGNAIDYFAIRYNKL